MNTTRATRIMYVMLSCLSILSAAGCTTNYRVDSEPAQAYRTAEKVDLRIELCMSDEFCGYVWEHRSAFGDGFRMELGPAFSANAEAMAKGVFRDVVISRGVPHSPATNEDAVLCPRVVSVERAIGATAFSEMKTTIDMEWALTDRDGNLIWVDTIQGVGAAQTGNMFTHKAQARKQGNRAIQDVFAKSAEAITDSPEVRAFAASR